MNAGSLRGCSVARVSRVIVGRGAGCGALEADRLLQEAGPIPPGGGITCPPQLE